MKNQTKELVKIIKAWKGSLIGIGLEERELIDAIEQNENIYDCKLLNSLDLETTGATSNKKRKKYVAIRKIRKKFKKKKHDNMLINYIHIAPYLKQVIKDSIYVTKEEIRIYGIPDEDTLSLLQKRYHRYQVSLEEKKIGNEFILMIGVQQAKNHVLLDFLYFISDTFYNFFELLSEFLVN